MVNTPNRTTRATMGVRAYARHRAVAASRIHRLLMATVIPRNSDGRIPVAEADRILDERAVLVPQAVWAANAARKRRQHAAKAATRARPATPVPAPTADPGIDDGRRIDVEVSDEALRWQLLAHVERNDNTPARRLLSDWENRMGFEQAAILEGTFVQLRALSGESARHSAILGELFGKLRHLLAVERTALERDVAALIETEGADQP